AGLQLVNDYVSPEEEAALMAEVDARQWAGNGIGPNPEVRRRTQQYGYEFSYRYRKVMRKIDEDMPASMVCMLDRLASDPRQLWASECGHPGKDCSAEEQLCERAHALLPPDSVIVNEYEPGQGEQPVYLDAPLLFGPIVCSLSLLSDCVMVFDDIERPGWSFRLLLPRRSLLVMRGYSRYRLRHSIGKELLDTIDDMTIERHRRVSLTIRRI
ncbi:hypothetical protein THASP1DRAFT_7964, partial [Thamnocephalis sphaerospora]